jgi:nitrogen fixation NifU-like protein
MAEYELYRQALLEHVRHPRNVGTLESPDRRASIQNPLCGDELEVMLRLDGDRICEVRVQPRVCSFALASSSLMSVLVSGVTLAEAVECWRRFERVLETASESLPDDLASLTPLLVVNDDRYRSRLACVRLAWEALEICLAPNHT